MAVAGATRHVFVHNQLPKPPAKADRKKPLEGSGLDLFHAYVDLSKLSCDVHVVWNCLELFATHCLAIPVSGMIPFSTKSITMGSGNTPSKIWEKLASIVICVNQLY